MKCFKHMKEVIDRADKIFEPFFSPDKQSIDALESYCEGIDVLIDVMQAKWYNIEVDERTMCIVVTIASHYMQIDLTSDNAAKYYFLELVKRAIIVDFEKDNESDCMLFKLTFPSVWHVA